MQLFMRVKVVMEVLTLLYERSDDVEMQIVPIIVFIL